LPVIRCATSGEFLNLSETPFLHLRESQGFKNDPQDWPTPSSSFFCPSPVGYSMLPGNGERVCFAVVSGSPGSSECPRATYTGSLSCCQHGAQSRRAFHAQGAEGLSISGPQRKLSWPQSSKCLLTTGPGDDYYFYWYFQVRKFDSENGPSPPLGEHTRNCPSPNSGGRSPPRTPAALGSARSLTAAGDTLEFPRLWG